MKRSSREYYGMLLDGLREMVRSDPEMVTEAPELYIEAQQLMTELTKLRDGIVSRSSVDIQE